MTPLNSESWHVIDQCASRDNQGMHALQGTFLNQQMGVNELHFSALDLEMRTNELFERQKRDQQRAALRRMVICLVDHFFLEFESEFWRRKGCFTFLVQALSSKSETFVYRNHPIGSFTIDDRACFNAAYEKSGFPNGDREAFLANLTERLSTFVNLGDGLTSLCGVDDAGIEELAGAIAGDDPYFQYMKTACARFAGSYPKYEDPRNIV